MRPRKPMYRVVISSWGQSSGRWAGQGAGSWGHRNALHRHGRHVSHADGARHSDLVPTAPVNSRCGASLSGSQAGPGRAQAAVSASSLPTAPG